MSGRAIKFGSPVQSSDGPAGTLGGVAIDARRRCIVHLIVEPEHHHKLAHLVPVDVVVRGDSDDDALTLRCPAPKLRAGSADAPPTLRCPVAKRRADMPVVETAMRPARDPQPFASGADWTEVF